jgi:hypothetical protein
MTDHEHSWFDKPVVLATVSDPPPAPELLRAERAGHPTWTLALGGVSGAIGAVAMMFVATEIARRLRLDADVIRTIGHSARALGADPFVVGVGVSAAVGSVVGVIFGALMRHTRRIIARLLAGMMLGVVLWTLVHAFVFKSFAAASLGALPFVPLIAGAAVFGICVAIARPPRVVATARTIT